MSPKFLIRNGLYALTLVAIALPACAKKSNDATPDAGVATVTSSVAQTPSGSPVPGYSGATPYGSGLPVTMASVINPRLPIPDRLHIEQVDRVPTSNPKVEDVFAALNKAGVATDPPAQHIAATYNARFCAGAKTSNGGALAISICEYANEADATAGRDLSEKMLKQVLNRKVWRDKTTIMAIIPQKTGADVDALEAKAVDTFTKL